MVACTILASRLIVAYYLYTYLGSFTLTPNELIFKLRPINDQAGRTVVSGFIETLLAAHEALDSQSAC
jgi:hypothetical protein